MLWFRQGDKFRSDPDHRCDTALLVTQTSEQCASVLWSPQQVRDNKVIQKRTYFSCLFGLIGQRIQ